MVAVRVRFPEHGMKDLFVESLTRRNLSKKRFRITAHSPNVC